MVTTVSIPLEQGSVFRPLDAKISLLDSLGLNPFRTGQCLSTLAAGSFTLGQVVSIPLEQGSVFRQRGANTISKGMDVSIPLEQGSVFRHLERNATFSWRVMSQSL